MSLKPPKKSDLDKSWMKARRDKPKKIQPEYHLIITEGTDTEPAYFGAMKEIINPNSLEIRKNCYVEKFVATLPKLSYLQFQRIGYFNIDSESTPDNLVFNRTVGLKDTWSKINK